MNKIPVISKAIKTNFQALKKQIGQLSGKENQSGRRLVVSSNCQTGGISAALQIIFPDDEIIPLPLANFTNPESKTKFVEKLKNADIWISIGSYELLAEFGIESKVQLIKIPIIRFSGFHPDLVYAKKKSTNELVTPHYNSAIAVWAYSHNLDVGNAEKLFNEQVFANLGYLTSWESSVNQLRHRFLDSDLEFHDFILPMRREGLFMYSLNHPKVIALVTLSKLIAKQLGVGPDKLDRYIDINDGLNEIIWPVYPEIGDHLALYSSYEWKMGEGKWLRGLRAFLESAYANYGRLNIAPDDLVALQGNEALYDSVLGMYSGIEP